jgi:ankyrin repeat protein
MSMRIQDALELLFDPGQRPFRLWVHCTDAPAATLYHAALCGFRSLVEQVLSKYPQDVNAMGGAHGTVLHAASRGNHRENVQTIVEHGGDVIVRGRCGKTPLHVAAAAGHLVTIRLFSLLHSRK